MEALFLRPTKPIEFGSREALNRFLDSVDALNEKDCLPLDVGDAEWVGVVTPSESFSESFFEVDEDISVIDARSVRSQHQCFCCLACESGLGQPDPSTDLLTRWAQIQFAHQSSPTTAIANSKQDMYSVSDPFVDSDTGIETPEIFTLDPPDNAKPSSTCSECDASLLSAKSFLSPPGFCEYSGRLICGPCFEPRQTVVPWKLISGLEHFRGSVSRVSARQIQADMYTPLVSLEDLQERLIESPRGCYIVKKCDEMRKLVIGVRNARAPCIVSEIEGLVVNLPGHIRSERIRAETELYSVADLVDLLAPGRDSVILTWLARCVDVIRRHACGSCQRVCVICDKSVSTLDPKYFECPHCSHGFHGKCFSWSSDGCPVCSGAERGPQSYPAIPLTDDSLDSF